MNFLNKTKGYEWNFCTVGGVTRVDIASGADIAHLGELDRKLWTVLSCPVTGLEFDGKTLSLLDRDGDGKIHVDEVIHAAGWITSAIKDPELLVKGSDTVPLDAINTDTDYGRRLYNSARRIIANKGVEKDSISVSDTQDSIAVFSSLTFNGDGIITEDAADNEQLRKAISACISTRQPKIDRSGRPGMDAQMAASFYEDCLSYAAWVDSSEKDRETIFPFGDDTAKALALVEELKSKVEDYFLRCSLARFDSDTAALLDVPLDSVKALSTQNLAGCGDLIASYPLARISCADTLPLNAVNPAWQEKVKALASIAFAEGTSEMSSEQWNTLLNRLAPYRAFLDSKKGAAVESLGIDYIREVIAGDFLQAATQLAEKDSALAPEFEDLQYVDKLTHLYRDFFHFLKNFVTLTDFYDCDREVKAIFQAGKLYIDQRCCELCIKVSDMGRQGEMASLSGMFLVFCHCTSKIRNSEMNIVAAVTVGDVNDLRVGKNAVFYDRAGNIWDAVVTSIVDNPISIGQAFWSPYRKLGRFVSDQINKFVDEKDSKVTSDMTAKVMEASQNVTDKEKAAAAGKQTFDIAKFAGIFAALGLALGAIGTFVVSLLKGFVALSWWQMIAVVALILLAISGPAMIKAWLKLRRRNLSPVLNANGWAVNARTLVNIKFGATLTESARLPKVTTKDPYSQKTPFWKKLVSVIVLLAVVFGILFLTDNLKFIGLPLHSEDAAVTETVQGETEGVQSCGDSTAETDGGESK